MILGTYRKTQRESDSALGHFFRVTKVGTDEGLDAICAKVEEFLAIVVLLFFGQSIFGLCNLKLSTPIQSHETYAEISSTWALMRSLIGDSDMEWAHRGQVPDTRQSRHHSAIRIRKWGS